MSRKQKNKNRFINFSILFFTLLLTLLVAELAAKIYIEQFASERYFKKFASKEQRERRNFKVQATTHRYLGFVPTPNYSKGANRHNRLGFRGEEIAIKKPKGTFRIACIGGSTTYTSAVEDYRKTYPYLLGEKLKAAGHDSIEVINAGMMAYSSFESLINFQLRLIELEPDLLIIYHAVNDINPRLVWPPESYRGDNSGHSLDIDQNVEFGSSFWVQFNLVRILKKQLFPKSEIKARLQRSGMAATHHWYDLRLQLIQKTYPKGIFMETPVAEMLETNPPIYFRRNLQFLITLAKQKNMKVVLSSFAYIPNEEGTSFFDLPAIQKAMVDHNQITKELAEINQLPYYDFAAEFPSDKKYFQDNIHVNETGSNLKAELFANFILENDILAKDSLTTEIAKLP